MKHSEFLTITARDVTMPKLKNNTVTLQYIRIQAGTER